MGMVGEAEVEPAEPASISQRRLYTRVAMPAIGSEPVSPGEVVAVKKPAAAEYRHFDCASVYGNEDAVGASL